MVFIPFLTAVLRRYGDQTVAAVFDAATMAATGAGSLAIMPSTASGAASPSRPATRASSASSP